MNIQSIKIADAIRSQERNSILLMIEEIDYYNKMIKDSF